MLTRYGHEGFPLRRLRGELSGSDWRCPVAAGATSPRAGRFPGRRLTWFPRSCHAVSGCEFRAAAGLGGPSGLTANVSEPGRRKQATGSAVESAPENRRRIPVTLRGLWILAFRAASGIPARPTATHRHGYDPAHERAIISRISGACSTKSLNTDMSCPPPRRAGRTAGVGTFTRGPAGRHDDPKPGPEVQAQNGACPR